MYFKVIWNIIPTLEFVCYQQIILLRSRKFNRSKGQNFVKKLTNKVIKLLAQSPSYKANCRSAIEGLFCPLWSKTSSLFFSQDTEFRTDSESHKSNSQRIR